MTEFDVNNFDKFRIGLASAEDIRSWSRGEVKKPETINYRTLKPEKDGLFCEKIFGPSKDWECNCGKYKRIRYKGIVCERCGVEVTRSKVRRERMGHIELAAPVSHIWYFKGSPSRLGYLLDIPPKELEKVLYFAAPIVTWVDTEAREEDAADLADECEADIEEMRAECEDRIEDLKRRFEEGSELDDDEEPMTKEELEEEIYDLREDLEYSIQLRRTAFDEFMRIEVKELIPNEAVYRQMKLNYSTYFRGGMGAESVRELLVDFDCESVAAELREVIKNGTGQKRIKATKRLKVVDAFLNSNNKPEDMILTVIPVIPPDLRPMVQLDGGRFASSDLNDLYRRVINRNNRLKRLLDLGAPEIIVNNEKRMLQEAVDSLFDNGRRGRPVTGTSNNRPLKSLSDMIKGKQGRFRQNLLGKRVDYSGRSVIVVGPTLKLHQCGLPKTMALELFKPFVIKRLVELEHCSNVKSARHAVERGSSFVWDVLEEVIADHPVLLNRAPTLHRLGIQAFEPVLVEGKAICLHPLVCAAFNADFDGDQMAVHVPLSVEAQAEARVLMLSTNNIKSPAHGKPLTVPSQDMIIGLYYLTSERENFPGEGSAYYDFQDAINAYESRSGVDLQASISVRLDKDTMVMSTNSEGEMVEAGKRINTTIGRIIFNQILPDEHPYLNYVMTKDEISRLVEDCTNLYKNAVLVPILDGIKSTGFHYATIAGITVSVYDATIPPEKEQLLAEAEKKVADIDEEYELGFLTAKERKEAVIAVWEDTTDKVGNAMEANFDRFNPIYMMANSGARGNSKQVRQVAGMRGCMANTRGETIDRPIKTNFREGLSVLEYFISTHGARKGLSDTALRTADSGYLTRRLVDVATDVIVREEDCGTTDFIMFDLLNSKGTVAFNLVGRCLAQDVVNPETGEVLAEAGSYLESKAQLNELKDAGISQVAIRTVMTCHAHKGICQKCYGWDLASSRPVNIGTAAGIIAAQSIGEPGTQLTMRTIHTGGTAGSDITQGLPRVTELFEARKPKGQAVLSEIDGTLQITEDKNGRILTVADQEGNIREYPISTYARLQKGLKDGDQVVAGQQLTVGSINPHDLLRLTDANTTLRYIVNEVQAVYTNQGVSINDKHIEVIARQMLRKVLVTDSGDSDYIPGNQINRFEFQDTVEKLLMEGKEPPVAQPVLLGITKASLATDSFLSAASFQETTKVLTDAAIEGRVDELAGLKENVIIGKHIPAGTGLARYQNVGLTYKGERVNSKASTSDALPDWAPAELKELEEHIPKSQEWNEENEGYLAMGGDYGSYLSSFTSSLAYTNLTSEQMGLFIFDDLGVSQRWANKFSEANIETVGDLIGKTRDELLRIDGIGVKAIEELEAGLEEHGLSHILDEEDKSQGFDVDQLLEFSFLPDDTVMIGGSSTTSAEDIATTYEGADIESIDDILANLPLGESYTFIDSNNLGGDGGEDLIG